ncbi:MAG TPA: DUF1800 family protein [Casimicrobiaceae bacterium]
MSSLRPSGGRGRPAALALATLVTLAPLAAFAATGTAIEFYEPVLRHYFMTAYPDEAEMLDAGQVVKGWKRTGGEFTIHTDPAPDRLAVCRFYGAPGSGLQTHFYTANPAECEWVKTLPKWKFEAIAFYIQVPQAGACPAGTTPVYRSFFSDQISDVNHRFTVDLTAAARQPLNAGWVSEGIVMCAPVADADLAADAVRLLEQASFGPTEALVQEVKAKGPAAWIDEQLKLNVTRYTQLPWFDIPQAPPLCDDDMTPPVTPQKYCKFYKITPTPVVMEFFRQSKSAPDQLRLRMAHAWHQIFVTTIFETYATAEFQQRLRDHAFGTFENLLLKYALSAQLGQFQNWVKNVPEFNGIRPNENFARELMQLFTIGVNQLDEDGTPRLDVNGQLVPNYGQGDIETLARVLTGYTFPTMPGATPGFWENRTYYFGDMIPFEAWHDQGSKSLLGGRLTLSQGGTAATEVKAAIRMLVDHPSTPPFIVKQMIQKTVTSSPSPGYISRAVQVFKNNGAGQRGDLAAVTRAILLDPEARGARKIDPTYGRLREPALFWAAMIRALDVVTDGLLPATSDYQTQPLFQPQTVFGYYPADYVLPGTKTPAPEFGIYTSATFLDRANQINTLLYNSDFTYGGQFQPQPFVVNALGTPSPALTAFLGDASQPDALVARVDRLFLHGTMSAAMRRTIVNAVNKLPPDDPLRRVKMAINLTLASVDYQVQK